MSQDERAGGWRLAGAVLVAVALAVAAGGLVGVLAYHAGDGSDAGKWEDLGRAFAALVGAVVVGVPVLLGALTVGVRRTVPQGRRLRTAVTVLAAVVAVPLLFGWITERARRAGVDLLGPPAALLVLAAAGAAIGGAAGVVPTDRERKLVGAAVAGVLLVAAIHAVRADDVAAERRVARYERNGAPLALIDGVDLDATFAGWDLQVVGSGHGEGEVANQYRVADPTYVGFPYVTLHFESGTAAIGCGAQPCEEIGRRGDDRPILARLDEAGEQLRYADVWVEVDGGRWRVEGDMARSDLAGVVEVLEALEAVDAATFVAGTDEGFNP